MKATPREQVRRRAMDRCEYCLLPQRCTILPHEVDHIRSIKHDGPTELVNLCWACARCNGFKQTDIAGYVPGTSQIVRLFNPRVDSWNDHFEWNGGLVVGKSDIGEATIAVLGTNRSDRVEHRRLLMMQRGYFDD